MRHCMLLSTSLGCGYKEVPNSNSILSLSSVTLFKYYVAKQSYNLYYNRIIKCENPSLACDLLGYSLFFFLTPMQLLSNVAENINSKC